MFIILRLSKNKDVLLSIALVLPIVIIAILTLTNTIAGIENPCMHWGQIGGGSVTVLTGGLCSSVETTSETSFQAFLGLALIQGGIFVGTAFAFLGVLKRKSILLFVGSIFLFLESVPFLFDGLFIFTLIPAVFFFSRARK